MFWFESFCIFCGEGGIRTPGSIAATYAFQAYALGHYATSPLETVNELKS